MSGTPQAKMNTTAQDLTAVAAMLAEFQAGGVRSASNILAVIYLARHEYATQSELAKAAGITTAAATGLRDNLAVKGLISSGEIEADRRNRGTILTEKGEMLVETAMRVGREAALEAEGAKA